MRLRPHRPASDSSCNQTSVLVFFLSLDAKTSAPCLWDKDSSFGTALTRRAGSIGRSLKGLSSPLIQNAYRYEIRLRVDLYGAGDIRRVTEFGELRTDGVECSLSVLRFFMWISKGAFVLSDAEEEAIFGLAEENVHGYPALGM